MGELALLFLGLASLILGFCDNVIFLDAQKKVLNQKFDTWWKSVENFHKVKFVLLFVKKINEILDLTFGASHFSKKLFIRCSKISAGLLLVTLSVLSLTNSQSIGVAPWKSYNESISSILKTTDELASPSNFVTFSVIDLMPIAPKINASTNLMLFKSDEKYFLFTLNTNGVYAKQQFTLIGHGGFNISYNRIYSDNTTNQTTNSLGNLADSPSALKDLVNGIKKFHNVISKYNSKYYEAAYTIGFYVVLFTVNTFLFILSLAFCRTILREVENSGRFITTLSLIFTNLFFVFCCSCALILFLTVLAVPIFWVLIPIMYQISLESFSTVALFLFSSSFALLIAIGNTTKLVLFIALLPSLFAALVGIFSLLAIKWRKWFYFIIKHLFIRLSQKNPFTVLVGIIVFISGLILIADNFIHFFGFL